MYSQTTYQFCISLSFSSPIRLVSLSQSFTHSFTYSEGISLSHSVTHFSYPVQLLDRRERLGNEGPLLCATSGKIWQNHFYIQNQIRGSKSNREYPKHLCLHSNQSFPFIVSAPWHLQTSTCSPVEPFKLARVDLEQTGILTPSVGGGTVFMLLLFFPNTEHDLGAYGTLSPRYICINIFFSKMFHSNSIPDREK